MLIDMHLHTSGISSCCKVDYRKTLDTAKDVGYDAVVITNHYTSSYFNDENYEIWIEKYIQEIYDSKKYGEEIGIKVFLGIEVTFEAEPFVHFLIYGADEMFLRKNKRLCDMTQENLYNLCHENDCILVQAHPFRYGMEVMNVNYLDGIEINCHPKYFNSYSHKIINIARINSLAVTVGCDYHADTYRPVGGMFLPDGIKTEKDLAQYIRKREKTMIQIHEPKDNSVSRIFVNT